MKTISTMKKVVFLSSITVLMLTACGESTSVTDSKIHYCDIKELEERKAKGEDVMEELLQKYSFLEATKTSAREEGYDDIDQILEAHECK